MDILYRKQADAQTEEEKESFRLMIDDIIEKRGHLETIVKKIITRVSSSHDHEQLLTLSRPEQLTNLECHHDLIKAFSRHCFDFGKNTYALKYAYVLANICEDGSLDTDSVIRTMRQVCKSITVNDRID